MRRSGKTLEHPRPQQVGRRRLDVHRLERDHHVGRGVHRGNRQPSRGAEVDGQDGAGVAAGLPHGIPVGVVEARRAERRGVLGEAEGVAPLGGRAPDLLGGELGVPNHGDGHRDEPPGVRGAPVVDVPVVVGADQRIGEVQVLALEHPGREGGERGEVERGEHAAGVHVLHPLVDVVAAGADLVETLGLQPVFLPGPPGDGVEGRGLHDHLAEDPDVGALLVADELGGAVLVLGRQVVDEQVRRLDEVVVDADEDHFIDGSHGSLREGRFRISRIIV